MWKVNFEKKSGTSHGEIPLSCTTRSAIMLQHLIIQVLLYYLSSGRLQEVKKEVVAYKRFQIKWFDLDTFGILENWSLRRGGHNWRFHCFYVYDQRIQPYCHKKQQQQHYKIVIIMNFNLLPRYFWRSLHTNQRSYSPLGLSRISPGLHCHTEGCWCSCVNCSTRVFWCFNVSHDHSLLVKLRMVYNVLLLEKVVSCSRHHAIENL